MRKPILAISLALAVGAAGLYAACGGDGSDKAPASSAPIATKPAAAAPNVASPATVKVAQSGSLGQVLTGPDGRTLYIFTKDVAGSGKSVCNGACATAWPPLMSTGGQPVKPDGLPGELSVITRDDGSQEVAYNGQPLYYYAADAAPGDTTGHGVGNVWYVVPPGTAAVSAPAPTEPTVKLAQAGALGLVLAGPDGRTLYMFTKDVAGSGKSACNGACATAWPPLMSTGGQPVKPDGLPGELSVITRDDGSQEVAYNGQPLYYYAADVAPGDTNGQGVGNAWYVVPVPASVSSGGSSSPAAASVVPGSTSNTAAANASAEATASTASATASPAPSDPSPTATPPPPTVAAAPPARPTATVQPAPTSPSDPYAGY